MSRLCTILVFYVAGVSLCNGQGRDVVSSIEHAHRLNTHAQKYLKTSNTKHAPFLNDGFLRNDAIADVAARAEDALKAVTENKYDVSSTCLNHTKIFLEALSRGEQWALRMIDAMGKPSSGLLDFNIRWVGSWEECRKVEATVNRSSVIEPVFDGKYCTAMFVFGKNPGATPLSTQALALYLGMCFPDSCSNADATGLTNTLESLLPINTTMLPPPIVTCQENKLEYSGKAIAVLTVCSIFLAIVAVATAYDIIVVNWLAVANNKELPSKMTYGSFNGHAGNGSLGNGHVVVDDRTPLISEAEKDMATHHTGNASHVEIRHSLQQETKYKPSTLGKLLLSFSVYTNAPKIFGTSQPAGTLTAVNGIRFISMTWVVLGHTYAFGLNTIDNIATYIPELESRLTFQAIGNATFAVDTFFVLSGLLVSYLSLKEMKKRGGAGKFKWGMFYFHRFWRLTPPYMLFLMTYVPLVKYFADGPFWPQETGFDFDECRDTWWTNLLYVNNLVKSDKMCMGWSWYLANDMQFFILSPIMLIPLYYSPLFGSLSCLALVLVNFISAGAISKHYELGSNFLLGGGGADSFDKLYIKPWCRIGPYAVGFFTGYVLYKTECKVKMSKALNALGWLLATTLALLILYGLYSPDNKETMSVDVAALYNATSRTVWGACIAWVVFACATGYGGWVNKLLSWKAVIPFSRLTYCAYLVHPVIMYTYYYSHRTLSHWYDLEVVYIFLGNLCLSYAVAFIVSLVFESPMMGLEKVLLGREKNS